MADIASLRICAVLRDMACLEAVKADLNFFCRIELTVSGNMTGLVADAAEGLGGAILHKVARLTAVVAVLLLPAVAGDVAGLAAATAENARWTIPCDMTGLIAVSAKAAQATTADKRAPATCVPLTSTTVANGVCWSLHYSVLNEKVYVYNVYVWSVLCCVVCVI